MELAINCITILHGTILEENSKTYLITVTIDLFLYIMDLSET